MITWSIICVRITLYEWDPRPFEPLVRTVLRRGVCCTWSFLTFGTTLLYVAELIVSSWATIRAQFLISALIDIAHTLCIHALYWVDPASQPTVPIHHTSGPRVGPPPWSAYAPCVYTVALACVLNASVRQAIADITGGTRLSIGLGQLHADELPHLPPPLGEERTSSLSEVDTLTDDSEVHSMHERLLQIADLRKRLEAEEAAIQQRLTAHSHSSVVATRCTGSGVQPMLSQRKVQQHRARHPPSTYGTNSELAELVNDGDGVGFAAIMGDLIDEARETAAPSEAALQREEALWKTLDALGIVPHDDGLDSVGNQHE